ncbi:hypothetical protein N2152v2_009091 [Parachlorella kessleri]
MAEYRLDLQLPDFLMLPDGWAGVMDEEECNKPAVQAPLLVDDTLSTYSGISGSMDACSEPFPCLADELEQQAKALEREWYCPAQPGAAVPSPRRPRALSLLPSPPAPAPVLKYSSVELVGCHQQDAAAALRHIPVATRAEPRQQVAGQGGSQQQQACASMPPTTPTKRSQGHSCSWNGSMERRGAEQQEVQSPARPLPLAQLPMPFNSIVAPLSLAVDNAESVRLGRDPICPSAWRGCSKEPWCNSEARHRGPCNHRAAVPGLRAYSQRQLFESGVNVEELCRAPELLPVSAAAIQPAIAGNDAAVATTQLPAQPAAEPATGPCPTLLPSQGTAARMPQQPAQPSGHQPAQEAALTAELHRQPKQQRRQHEALGGGPATSSGCPAELQPCVGEAVPGPSHQGSHGEGECGSEEGGSAAPANGLHGHRSKRQRLADGSLQGAPSGSEAALSSGNFAAAGQRQQPVVRQASVHSLPALLHEPGGVVVPVALAEEVPALDAAAGPATSTGTACAAATRTGLRAKAGGRKGMRARSSPCTSDATVALLPAEDQQQLRQSATAAAPAAGQAGPSLATGRKVSTPAKAAGRQFPKTPDAAHPVVHRSGQRRIIVHWTCDQVTDPRTGRVVRHVDPGTFCTQCFTTSTPVWRAGPFGHKTLCNACGVRYMKYAKNKK